MNYSFLTRSRVTLFFILCFFLVLVSKLFLLQIVHRDAYAETADRQYSTPSGNIFERGTIFFSSKDGELISAAAQTSGYKVAINPEKITNPEDAYQKLNTVVKINHDDFISRAEKIDDP